MSFILDALKKSESERHRHSGPVLMDVRIAPPRRRLPMWVWVIAGVLLVNLLLLVWLLWLGPNHNPAPAPAASVTASSIAPPAPQPAAPPPPVAAVPAAPPVLPPAAPAATAPAPAIPANADAAAAQPVDTANLPRVQELIAAGAGLPEMHLSLHVYDPSATKRYVLLNGAKLREGEFTPEGLKLLQITQTGAVLEWRGRRMFLGAGD